jgi:hypothetical protein
MGYYMNQQSAKFRIAKENLAGALAAIKALADKPEQMGGGCSTGEKWYSWVNTDGFLKAETLVEALGEWRWQGFLDDAGNLTEICFDGEKLGDDAILLEAIAPFVEAGSYIEMEGEEGYHWKWCFDGKTLTEKKGRVVYED